MVLPFALLLSSLLSVSASAIPSTLGLEKASAATPRKLVLSQHVLAEGQKPRDRARLVGHHVRGRDGEIVKRVSSEPLADYYNGTDLQWYGSFTAGTPAQQFTVVFDTGSFSAEIPGSSCKNCGTQSKFVSTASSTYYSYGTTTTENFATGVGVDPSDYESLTLAKVRDTVSVAGLSATKTDFYLITSESAGFAADPFDGIVGMGYQASGTFFQNLVNAGLPAIFGMYLTPKAVGNAELTLGGIDSTKFTKALTYIPVIKSSSFWSLTSTQFSVNGKSTTALTKSTTIIFDSGTSNVVFPKATTEALYSLISPNIKAVGTKGAYGIACSAIGSITATLDFTFKTAAGASFNLTIPPSELNVGPFRDQPSMCQTLINAQAGYNILGGSVLKGYYSVWDQTNSRMGFSPTR